MTINKVPAATVRVLGIDPGSLVTGYGVIDVTGSHISYVTCGCVRTSGEEMAERLREIFDGISEVLAANSPNEIAIERVFVNRNPDSAIKLGQARGVALSATFGMQLPVFEYAARQVKQGVVGSGGADKLQVQHMVRALLGLSGKLQADAADALAVAICHANHRQLSQRLGAAARSRR